METTAEPASAGGVDRDVTSRVVARVAALGGDHMRRVAFGLIGAVGFISVAIPTGPQRPLWFVVALAVALANYGLPRALRQLDLPAWTGVLPLLVATAVVAMLGYSAGSITGLAPLFLLPLMYSALYHEAWESATVIPAIAVALAIVYRLNGQSTAFPARLLLLWVAMLTVIGVTTHGLRNRLLAAVTTAAEEARQSDVMAEATRDLTLLDEPDQVLRTAARLADALASPGSGGQRRGQYFTVSGDTYTLAADSDSSHASAVGVAFRVIDHPVIRQVVGRGEALNAPIDVDKCGPEVRRVITENGITHGAYLPVRLNGEVHGVLSASGRGEPVPEAMFTRLQSLGRLVELALAGAVAHAQLEEEASTDPLTGVANRRELARAMERLPRSRPFAILAVDIDTLKVVNDAHGHAAGDALIQAVATAMASVVRREDTLARTGGDEFAIVTVDTDVSAATLLASRIHSTVSALALPTGLVRVSIGICVAQPGVEAARVQAEADAALYGAKEAGRGTTVLRQLPDRPARRGGATDGAAAAPAAAATVPRPPVSGAA